MFKSMKNVVILTFSVFSITSLANTNQGNEYICGINTRVVLANGHGEALVVGYNFVLKNKTVIHGQTRISGVRTSKDSFRLDPNEKEYFVFILPNEIDKTSARLVSSKINLFSDKLIWAGNDACRLTNTKQ